MKREIYVDKSSGRDFTAYAEIRRTKSGKIVIDRVLTVWSKQEGDPRRTKNCLTCKHCQ